MSSDQQKSQNRSHPLWSYSGLSDGELRGILSDPDHERFAYMGAKLLEASLDIDVVFRYIDREILLKYYEYFRRMMGSGVNSEKHKLFWDRMVKVGREKMGIEPVKKGKTNNEKNNIDLDPAYYIGRRVRRLREQEGLSQAELGERLGVSKQSISNFERGKQRISFERLQRVLNELGYKLHLIFQKRSKP
jgi:DNA-binding XRE family transcriptional regulator